MHQPKLNVAADWKARFRAESVFWVQVARRAARHGLVATNPEGVVQLYAWDRADGSLRQLTHTSKGRVMGSLSADGRHVYYLDDSDGNEVGHLVAVPWAGGEPVDLTPDMPLYSTFGIVSDSLDGSTLAFCAAGADGFTYYALDLDASGLPTGRRVFWRASALSMVPHLNFEGTLAAITTTAHSHHNAKTVVVVDTRTGDVVGELVDEGSSVTATRFFPLPGDERLVCVTDRSGFTRPVIWHPRTGERRDLDLPELDGVIVPWDVSPDGRTLLLCRLWRAAYSVYRYDLETDVLTPLDHPSGTLGGYAGSFYLPDGDICATRQTATTPSHVVRLDGTTGRLAEVMLGAGEVPPGRPWRSITFPSTGDTTIQAWVATPPGDGPFPTILHTHGGPTAVQVELFSPEAQAWLDHGFAFCSVNYRGSTTFGRAFERSIWGNLGTVEIDDMAAAQQWLVENGVAQPDAIFLTGGSYGGYLTLQALGRRPELWAGGMAQVAIADWALMYEDQAETLRGYQRALFGGTPAERAEATRVASPITYAADVAAPILVIQGRNDTRCPARQMEVYEQTLRDLGKSIEVVWFDAGHGSYEMERRIDHQAQMMAFARRVLGQ